MSATSLPVRQTDTQTPSAPVPQAWYNQQFLEYAVWRWAGLLGVLLLAFIAGKVLSYALRSHGRRLAGTRRLRWLGTILNSLSGPAALITFAAGLYAGGVIMDLRKHGDVDVPWFWNAVCSTLVALAAGWAVYRLVDLLELALVRWTAKTRTQLDDQLVPIVRKTLRAFILIVLGLFIAQNIFHWNIGALLAGLGLGGLAFALAAQDALKNLFGSVTIFADRPFQLGDRVRVAGFEGFIEQVGFRSTRLRTFDGTLVTIPNSTVADSPVDNVARRPSIRRVLNVTVTYDTPPEKVQRGVDILTEMLQARRQHLQADRPARIYFNDFNAASLNIIVYYWFAPPDWWEYLAFNHAFNMELLRRFNAEGIEFAFPTQTLYLKQDSDFAADLRVQPGAATRET